MGGMAEPEGVAALAQLDPATNSVDFARLFSNATAVVAVTEAPEQHSAKLVALATSHLNIGRRQEIPKAFLLEIDSQGNLMHAPISVPIQKEFVDRGLAQHVIASLSFDSKLNTVVAFGLEFWLNSSQLTIHRNSEREISA